MPLKVKAQEKLQKIGKYEGTYRYMQACWDAAGEVIKAWATEGHSVALPGLGTMRFGIRAKSVAKVDEVKTGLVTSRRIIFTPAVDLKDELANTAIQITCYDRDCDGARSYELRRRIKKSPGLFLTQGFRDLKRRRLPTLPHCIAVPSAQVGLTSLFGMGRGGTPLQ